MKRSLTIVLTLAFLVLTLTGCQGTDQYLGVWQTTYDESTEVEGTTIDFQLLATLEVNEDNSFSLNVTLADEDKLYSDLSVVFDDVKAAALAESGLSEEEFDLNIESSLGMTWDEFTEDAMAQTKSMMDEMIAEAILSGTWEVSDDALNIYEEGAETASDSFVLDGETLTSVEGFAFTKAA